MPVKDIAAFTPSFFSKIRMHAIQAEPCLFYYLASRTKKRFVIVIIIIILLDCVSIVFFSLSAA